MRDTDLQLILQGIERVAAEADQLLQATKSGDATSRATAPSRPRNIDRHRAEAIAHPVRKSPWRTLGIAAGIGILIGLLLLDKPRK